MLEQAIALHRHQQFDLARELYEEVLASSPRHVDALNLLGLLCYQTGNSEQAVDLISRAIAIQPSDPSFHLNLGNALSELGQLEAAMACYDRAIALDTKSAQAYYNRGIALRILGKLAAAVDSYDRAIALDPGFAEAHFNRGLALRALGRVESALQSYEQAFGINGDYAKALHNHGLLLLELGKPDAAIVSFDRIIATHPRDVKARNARGNALAKLGRYKDALAEFDWVIAAEPSHAQAISNRANTLRKMGALEAAISGYSSAIEIEPDFAEAYYNRGVARAGLGEISAACLDYERAIGLRPDFAEAHWNLALALLLRGEFDRGWAEYEWRWQASELRKQHRDLPGPIWLGSESIAGKTLLLHAEQGLGDTIQFCRYAKSVAALGAHAVLEVDESLINLLGSLDGAPSLIARGEPLPDFDFHCPLLSLPLAFQTTLARIPEAGTAYLRSLPEKRSAWAARLANERRPLVGLAWSGNPEHINDSNRSIPLSLLLDRLPEGCLYVSLQKDVREIDQASLAGHPDVLHFDSELADFSDTAALCDCLDLIISVDTSIAHLGGALGKPTWVMLPRVPDWRWLLERDDSPWYPTVKLYRQETKGDWGHVLARVAADLAQLQHKFA